MVLDIGIRFSKTIANKLSWPSGRLFAQNPIWPPPAGTVNAKLQLLLPLEPYEMPPFPWFLVQAVHMKDPLDDGRSF